MTLDEAIKNTEEMVDANERLSKTIHPAMQIFDYGKIAEKHRQLAEWLKELKQLREQTRWIPVSEKLPKENEYIGNIRKYYLIQDEYGDMQVAHLNKVGWIPMDSLKAIGNEVTAWMPLPVPYNADKEKEE